MATKAQKDGLDDILRRSCRLIAKRSFHGTSMRDIAQETGRSLSGLYHYFRDKQELLYLINLNGFTSLRDTFSGMLEEIEKPDDRLYALIYSHIHYFVANRDAMRVMIWGTHDLAAERNRSIVDLKKDYNSTAQMVVAEVYRKITGETLGDLELTRKTFLLFGMMNWAFGWYSPQKHGNSDSLVDEVYSTFMRGLYGCNGSGNNLPDVEAIRRVHQSRKNAGNGKNGR